MLLNAKDSSSCPLFSIPAADKTFAPTDDDKMIEHIPCHIEHEHLPRCRNTLALRFRQMRPFRIQRLGMQAGKSLKRGRTWTVADRHGKVFHRDLAELKNKLHFGEFSEKVP
jgi:hypothetical protein